jgi:tetratricopeptide (TPR) repeat protein
MSWEQCIREGIAAVAAGHDAAGYDLLAGASAGFGRILHLPETNRDDLARALRDLAAVCDSQFGPSDPRGGEVLELLGHLLIRVNAAPDAERLFLRAFDLRRDTGENLLSLRLGIFNAYVYQKKYANAEELWNEVIPTLATLPPDEGREFLSAAYTTMRERARHAGDANAERLVTIMQSTFISYGHPDEAFARKLHEALERRGVVTFFFPEHAEPGERLHREMRKGVNRFDRIILICSRHSLDRPGVLYEIEESLSREARDGGALYLIPIRLDDYIFNGWAPPRPDLVQALCDRVVVDFRLAAQDPRQFEIAIEKLLRALTKENNTSWNDPLRIDEHWLDDAELARISRQVPSTAWGKELMRDAWPARYQGLLSSDTYRGCAMVLSTLFGNMRVGMQIGELVQIIGSVDQSIKTSHTLPTGTDRCGGASLAITNAWQRAHSGLTIDQIGMAFESELIYAAQMFMKAHQQEIAGEKLP